MLYGVATDSNNDPVRFSVNTDTGGDLVEGSIKIGLNAQISK